MFKNARIMFVYTESSLHCGSGSSLGVVDLPIQREKYTDYPVCQASGVKGVVREWFEFNYKEDNESKKKIKYTFGPDFGDKKEESDAFAGAATFTDARLLLFPVKSLNGVFAYTTSRFALQRLKRDLEMAGGSNITWDVPDDSGDTILGVEGSKIADNQKKVVLEEYIFDFKPNDSVKAIAEWIANNAIPSGNEYKFWKVKAKTDIIILPDNAFRDFVKLSTEVQSRIRIINDTKTVDKGALFYEEALPSDSLLYSVVMAHDAANATFKAEEIMKLLNEIDGNRLQFGGDATIGKGIVNVNFLKEGE
jgi:CRISPR-associated protein Cmr4